MSKDAFLFTDEYRPYRSLGREFKHEIVNHSASEYVRGNAHTNSIENFWSLLKRGIIGIYHNVSEKHLERYINEFSFRYNNRDLSEGSKFDVCLANCEIRLNYKILIE